MNKFIPKRALAVTPHGDDVTLFAGGTLARWASNGCQIMVIRVTQDEKDSLTHSVQDTIAINSAQFQAAMAVLGVAETCDFGFRDCELMDVPYSVLREKFIRKIRQFKPEVIVSFDPSTTDDDNPDHPVVARAVADASWSAGYPNFHPEHRDEGLLPHVPRGNFYFTRDFVTGATVLDIAPFLEQKIEAVLTHQNMMCTLMADQKRRIQANGFSPPFLCERNPEDYAGYWEVIVGGAAQMAAAESDFEYAERFTSTLITKEDQLLQLLSSLQ
jgi:LmbE family N-acetylglucosaminyl deacetylase